MEAGHYCLPKDNDGIVHFQSLSKLVEEQFVSLMKYGHYPDADKETTDSIKSTAATGELVKNKL